jgi:TolA-binding protein
MRVAQNRLEDAVLDYLRTAILFKAQEDVQPEAVFKAAQTLEKLRDQRAKDFYKRVVQDYPGSAYAAQARAKL